MAPHGAICTSGAEEIKTATSPANNGGFVPAATDGKRFNPNVLLETGMAIAQQGGVLRDLFILKPAKRPVPSDLCGFLFTDYEVVDNEGAIKIVDVHGFQAALRSAVLRRARERNMIGQRNELYVGPEDEHEDDSPPAPSGDGGGAPN